jgi:AcrR family transcriptional regulator
MAASSRQRLLDVAFDRFYRDGFRNVGLDQVISEVGISKTAFYKHFESKEDLMLAALKDHNGLFQTKLRMLLDENSGNSPVQRLLSMFDLVNNVIESEGFRGCAFVNVAIEFPLPHEPVHLEAVRSKEAIHKIVCDACVRANARDPEALAEELCLIMEGAYVTRHVSKYPHTIEIARRLAERAIRAHLCADG